MPKPPDRHNSKRTNSFRNGPSTGGKPKEISALLERTGLGRQTREFVARQGDWADFFSTRLERPLFEAIGHYVEKDGTLTVFVDSAAWAARLRFALPPIWDDAQAFRPGVVRWAVKIQPAAARTGART